MIAKDVPVREFFLTTSGKSASAHERDCTTGPVPSQRLKRVPFFPAPRESGRTRKRKRGCSARRSRAVGQSQSTKLTGMVLSRIPSQCVFSLLVQIRQYMYRVTVAIQQDGQTLTLLREVVPRDNRPHDYPAICRKRRVKPATRMQRPRPKLRQLLLSSRAATRRRSSPPRFPSRPGPRHDWLHSQILATGNDGALPVQRRSRPAC